MNRYKVRKLVSGVFFVWIFVNLFFVVQHIFIPKWYFPDNTIPESPTRTIRGFYEEEENSIEVLMLGSSHMIYGFSPMELYDQYKIKSYNLGSSAQPIMVSYYLLEEALRTQKPGLVVLDVSVLYSEANEVKCRYVMGSMPFSLNKIKFAKSFSEIGDKYNIIDVIFPVFRYHDRWKEIDQKDFTDFYRNKRYYCKGYYTTSGSQNALLSIEEMNEQAEELRDLQSNLFLETCGNTERLRYEREEGKYTPVIPDENIRWLLKIKEVCKKNNIDLLTVKIPALESPISYAGAWTYEKYNNVKKVCDVADIRYLDLLYETDNDIDWAKDSRDYGKHLNYTGSRKISKILNEYMVSNYDLRECQDVMWDKELKLYKQMMNLMELQNEDNFVEYVDMLKSQYSDKVIFLSASDEMSTGLGEDGKEALHRLGLITDFQGKNRCAYIAVIEDGKVTCEASSNSALKYEGELDVSKVKYVLKSAGWYSQACANILIENNDYSVDQRGLNIVVYDEDKGLVLDSVCFDTCVEERKAVRKNWKEDLYRLQYEDYMIENQS